jgi:hypothetical protein
MGQLEEDLDTYKYSDYPESGISPDQHAPPAAAARAAAAPAAAPAAAAAAGGIPLLAPAAAGRVPPAAPPGPFPFAAAAAALPADAAEFALPAEWQDVSPLAPNSSDSSVTDKFFNATSANSTQDEATALGEDSVRLEGQSAQDHGTDRLEEDPDDHHPRQRGLSQPFQGFPTPPRRVSFSPHLQYFKEESEREEEEVELQQPGEPGGAGAVGRGTRGNLAEAYQVDPACSSIDEQALYYDALVTQVDKHTKEADCALQALQGASLHEQLQQRTAIRQRSRIL